MILSKTDSPHLRVRIGSSVELPTDAEHVSQRADAEKKQETDKLFLLSAKSAITRF
ncbi:MAG: hypothetical protein HPY94_00630 [Clostridia bacterium]|nr:hypothetical protein [Clostridia bacterium]